MSKMLIDDEGENRAVRALLAFYGGAAAVTVENMRRHLKTAGFDGAWPDWVNNHAGHLTKAGAQIWIRHLLKLEQHAPVQEPVGLPESETEEMHDAVMEVLYQGGVTRGNTYLLWQAYRKVLAATPQAPKENT